MCYIFLESSCKIQFNGHAKNVTCHMCYMSHFTNVTCHKYRVTKNLTKYPMCYIFLESFCKILLNGHAKTPHVTCVMCHMAQMLHVTKIKLPRMLPNTPCVIYFWKADAKSSSMVQFSSNVIYDMCYMLHVTNVICHKYHVAKNFTKDPMCYIFLESWYKIQSNGHAKDVTCQMTQILHVTNIRLPRILPKTSCVIYFW